MIEQPSREDRYIAVLTHLGGILIGFIPSLIVWIIKKGNSNASWLSAQALQALNFQITIFLGYVVVWALTFLLTFFHFILVIIAVINIIFCILAAVKVSQGVDYRYPFALRLFR